MLNYLLPLQAYITLAENMYLRQQYLKVKNIILVGGADPDLSLKVIDSLAGLVSKDMRLIDTLFIDGGLFDDRYYGKGWMG